MERYVPVDQYGRYIRPPASMPLNPPPMNPAPQLYYYQQPPPPPPPPPPVFPKPETYAVLWKLAEDYFLSAQNLSLAVARTRNEQQSYKYHTLLLSGIKCLNAVLLLDRQQVSIKVEMQTRLRLAHVLVMETENLDMAEDLLSKGVLRMPKNSEFYDIKFAMQQLQATILSRTSLKASRSHLKTCLDEASDREMLVWQYSFMLTRLQHLLPQPDVHELTQHTNTIHALRSLAQKNSDCEMVELSYLLEISHSLKFNISAVNIASLLSMATELSSRNPVRQNHIQLLLMRMILHILHLTRLGHGHAALAKLKEHHQLMDSLLNNDTGIWDKEGKFDLLICNGQARLWFQWFGQSEAFVFGYILSGAVYFPDSTTDKALNFFREANRVVDSTALSLGNVAFTLTVVILFGERDEASSWLSEVIARRDRLFRLKRYSLLYAAFAALLRSQWESAIRAATQLNDFKKTYFTNPTSDDTAFTYLYNLLIAIQNHYTGHLDVALDYYSTIPAQAGDTYLLALLNKSLILRGGSQQDHSMAIKILDEVERRLVSSQQQYPQLRNAFYLVRGIASNEVLRSKELLGHVLQSAADHLSTQLRIIAFTVTVARFYINTSTDQAEKMGIMAYIPAQKSRDQLWQLMNGNLLAEVYVKQDKQIKKAKQEALNEEHRQAAAIPFNLGKST